MNRTKLDHRALWLAAAVVLSAGGMAQAQEEGGETAVEIVRTGIAHDSLYALEMSGEWGLAVGNFGLMLETADGGGTWSALTPVTKLALLGVSQAGDRVVVVGQQGLVLTQQAGGAWETVDSGLEVRLLNVDMNGAGLAITVGEFGFIGRSRDFGASWEPLTLDWADYNDEGYEPHLYDAVVGDDGSILVAGEFGLVLRSTDGGETFEAVHRGAKESEESVFDLHVATDGSNAGYAVGQEGLVLKTEDGGASWRRVEVDTNANLLGVWTGNGEVVITGIREMLRSSDDGASFTNTDDINIIRTWFQGVDAGVSESQAGEKGFLRQQSVYIVGARGTIARVLK